MLVVANASPVNKESYFDKERLQPYVLRLLHIILCEVVMFCSNKL